MMFKESLTDNLFDFEFSGLNTTSLIFQRYVKYCISTFRKLLSQTTIYFQLLTLTLFENKVHCSLRG